MTASNGIANTAPQSIRDAAAEIARFAYGSWSALPGDLAEGRLTRHYLLDVLTRATASAYESGLEDGRREMADAVPVALHLAPPTGGQLDPATVRQCADYLRGYAGGHYMARSHTTALLELTGERRDD